MTLLFPNFEVSSLLLVAPSCVFIARYYHYLKVSIEQAPRVTDELQTYGDFLLSFVQ